MAKNDTTVLGEEFQFLNHLGSAAWKEELFSFFLRSVCLLRTAMLWCMK